MCCFQLFRCRYYRCTFSSVGTQESAIRCKHVLLIIAGITIVVTELLAVGTGFIAVTTEFFLLLTIIIALLVSDFILVSKFQVSVESPRKVIFNYIVYETS